jgi:hypothetical protein
MTRLAYLILGSYAPEVLGQHIRALKGYPVQFFVHVDHRLDLNDYRSKVGSLGDITFLSERIPIFWGGFSMIRATVALAETAMACREFASYTLISDDTFPLQPIETVIDGCLADVAQLQIWDATASADRVARYTGYHYRDSNMTNFRHAVENSERCVRAEDIAAMKEIEELMKRGKKNVHLYGGSQWWSLKERHLHEILNLYHTDRHMTQSFAYSMIPDESYFQTAFKICFPKEPTKGTPVLVDWSRPPPRPYAFETCADLERAQLADNGKHVFVRKVRPKAPDELSKFTQLLQSTKSLRSSRNIILQEFEARYRTDNLALNKPATQSSVSEWSIGSSPELDAKTANDGNIRGYRCFHTALEPNPWWQVDMECRCRIHTIAVFNREDMTARLTRFDIQVSDNAKEWQIAHSRTDDAVWGDDGAPLIISFPKPISARFVRLVLNGTNFLHFRELQIFGERH